MGKTTLTKHDKGILTDHIIGAFMAIKKISHSGEIDRLCLDGIDKVYKLSEAEGIQKELDEARKRRIDPTS